MSVPHLDLKGPMKTKKRNRGTFAVLPRVLMGDLKYLPWTTTLTLCLVFLYCIFSIIIILYILYTLTFSCPVLLFYYYYFIHILYTYTLFSLPCLLSLFYCYYYSKCIPYTFTLFSFSGAVRQETVGQQLGNGCVVFPGTEKQFPRGFTEMHPDP